MFAEWLKPVLFIVGYVLLMRWILPALGIPTCMSGACGLPNVAKLAPREGKDTHHVPEDAGPHV